MSFFTRQKAKKALIQASQLHAQGVLAGAETAFRRALEHDPSFAEAHYHYAELLTDLVRWQDAEREYRQTIALDPKFKEAYNGLGALLHRQQRREEAEKAYKQALTLDPRYVYAQLNLGTLYTDSGRFTQARQVFQEALGNTDDPELRKTIQAKLL